MSNGPLSETTPMNSELSPRVSALEVGVRSLSNEMETVKAALDRLSSNVVSGFAEIRRDSAASGRTNWGWVFAAVAMIVAIFGSVGAAWVRPLQINDEAFERRLGRAERELSETYDIATRSDERMKVYREVGILPDPKN